MAGMWFVICAWSSIPTIISSSVPSYPYLRRVVVNSRIVRKPSLSLSDSWKNATRRLKILSLLKKMRSKSRRLGLLTERFHLNTDLTRTMDAGDGGAIVVAERSEICTWNLDNLKHWLQEYFQRLWMSSLLANVSVDKLQWGQQYPEFQVHIITEQSFGSILPNQSCWNSTTILRRCLHYPYPNFIITSIVTISP